MKAIPVEHILHRSMAKIKHMCCSLLPGEPVINIFNQMKSSHLAGTVKFGTGYSCAYLQGKFQFSLFPEKKIKVPKGYIQTF